MYIHSTSEPVSGSIPAHALLIYMYLGIVLYVLVVYAQEQSEWVFSFFPKYRRYARVHVHDASN